MVQCVVILVLGVMYWSYFIIMGLCKCWISALDPHQFCGTSLL